VVCLVNENKFVTISVNLSTRKLLKHKVLFDGYKNYDQLIIDLLRCDYENNQKSNEEN